eukprot:1396120-Lingulodinium_polyedra.AAC.1
MVDPPSSLAGCGLHRCDALGSVPVERARGRNSDLHEAALQVQADPARQAHLLVVEVAVEVEMRGPV